MEALVTAAEIPYQGRELESFALARNWKAYVRGALQPYLSGSVIEVGAGIGETARALRPGAEAESWLCVEPDPGMAARLAGLAARGELGPGVTAHAGTLVDLAPDIRADCILYVDVLEHIEDDAGELVRAAARLRPGGRIVVLSPAFPFLYSPFDAGIGHFRRYTKRMLRAIAPAGLDERGAFYLDSMGALASAANKVLLRQSMPTKRQVLTWDRLIVPVSRVLDPVFAKLAGRSVVVVWQRR
jgi:SAM-dependent methyltransferase